MSDGLEDQVDLLARRLAEATATVERLSVEVDQLRRRVDGDGPRFAALYSSYADEFRGTAEEVTEKLRHYLPDVRRAAMPATADRPRVVDVGCGRAEWLALLAEVGVPAVGVDANADFVAAATTRGLDAVHADAVDHLGSLPAGSLDLVTAFHVVEHLDVETVLALFQAAAAALRPGGTLLLETPNPANLVMGASNFYLDPTHRSPVPPRLLRWLVTASGFVDVEVRLLHPDDPVVPAGGEPTSVERLVDRLLCGPRDYAVLGYRPA